jgi:twitching motility protein PilT
MSESGDDAAADALRGDGLGLFAQLLKTLRASGASDLHLVPDEVPRLRLGGSLRPLDQSPVGAELLSRELQSRLSDVARRRLEERGNATFAWSSPVLGRFRLSVRRLRGSLASTVRAIPAEVAGPLELGLPQELLNTILGRGLFLVTGPPGSGRSTTVASILGTLAADGRHIVTFEDPVEHVLSGERALVVQHEISEDFPDPSSAVATARHADADVVYAPEPQSFTELETLLELATPDRLVVATMPTRSFVSTIRQLLDLCPAHRRREMRERLAERLSCVLSQQLVERAVPPNGRVLAVEFAPLRPATRNLLRKGEIASLYGALQTHGEAHGPQTMNRSLAYLYNVKAISLRSTLVATPLPEELHEMINRTRSPAPHRTRPQPRAAQETAPPKACRCAFGPGACGAATLGAGAFCAFCGEAPFHNHCERCGQPVKSSPSQPERRCAGCSQLP